MKNLGIKALMVSALALFGLGLATVTPVSAQNDPFGGTVTPGITTPGATQGLTGDSIIDTIRSFINWVLTFLGLIALIVLLYGGFQMVTAAGDEEKYNAGFTILKQAAIGLVFIGVAWLIISIIFFVIAQFA